MGMHSNFLDYILALNVLIDFLVSKFLQLNYFLLKFLISDLLILKIFIFIFNYLFFCKLIFLIEEFLFSIFI